MDTTEKEEAKKGSTPVVKTFKNSSTLSTLGPLMSEGYSQELLSRRLQGTEVKEALVLTILSNFRSANPGKVPPKWMPDELQFKTDEEIMARLN